MSTEDLTLLDSLKPEFVIAAFKYKGWRPMPSHQLPPRLRDAEATALIKGDSHAVVYTGDVWQTRKLETVKAFAVAEKISVSSAISYFADFLSPDLCEGNLKRPLTATSYAHPTSTEPQRSNEANKTSNRAL